MLAKRFQMLFLDEQRLTVLLQEKADSRRGGRRTPLERVLHDRSKIEIVDHLQRPPDFLPAATEVGCIEHVDECSLERRQADRSARV